MAAMTTSELIIEADQKLGFDSQTAAELHSELCKVGTGDLAAAYAAMQVQEALRLYRQADCLIRQLAVIAKELD